MSTQGNDEVADILFEMLKELASELDLHYEDEDFFALSPSITVMQRAAGYLNKSGRKLPSVYEHVLRRYQRQRN